MITEENTLALLYLISRHVTARIIAAGQTQAKCCRMLRSADELNNAV
jgi:hypothetical protein